MGIILSSDGDFAIKIGIVLELPTSASCSILINLSLIVPALGKSVEGDFEIDIGIALKLSKSPCFSMSTFYLPHFSFLPLQTI